MVRKLGDWVREKVMFEQDRGDELLRRTVFGYEICWIGEDTGGDGKAKDGQERLS